MNRFFVILIALISTSFFLAEAQAAPMGMKMPKCTVCHSKNPKMVAMHTALEFKDCIKCHGPGGIWPEERRQEQITSDPKCSVCHTPAKPVSQ